MLYCEQLLNAGCSSVCPTPQPFKNQNAEVFAFCQPSLQDPVRTSVHHHMTGKKTSVFQAFRKGTLLWVHMVLECLHKGGEVIPSNRTRELTSELQIPMFRERLKQLSCLRC